MKISNLNTFLARDAVAHWRKMIRGSKSSIVIVSPYLDDLVMKLLNHSKLSPSSVTILTDISPTSSARAYRKQLQALFRLVDHGYMVKSLDRVHAKLLISDWSEVSIGSQNFTTYARKSREVTAISRDVQGFDLMETVRNWLALADVVARELLEELLAGTVNELSRAYMAEIELERSVSQVRDKFVLSKQQIFQDWKNRLTAHIADLVNHEEIENSQVVKTAWIANPPGQYYKSLMTSSRLTLWRYGSGNYEHLKSLYMYPILFSDTGIMGFARITQSRITYIRSGVRRNYSTMLGTSAVVLDLDFPKDSKRSCNVNLIVRQAGGRNRQVVVGLIFDGEQLTYVDDNADDLENSEQEYVIPWHEEVTAFRTDIMSLRDNRELLHELFAQATIPFRYSEGLRTHNHNIRDYAEGFEYRLALVRNKEFICLVAQCMDADDLRSDENDDYIESEFM